MGLCPPICKKNGIFAAIYKIIFISEKQKAEIYRSYYLIGVIKIKILAGFSPVWVENKKYGVLALLSFCCRYKEFAK